MLTLLDRLFGPPREKVRMQREIHWLREQWDYWERKSLFAAAELGLQDKRLRELTAERDRWIRLFNRLDAAITHHRDADRFKEDNDDALYAARDRVLKDAGGSQVGEQAAEGVAGINAPSGPRAQSLGATPAQASSFRGELIDDTTWVECFSCGSTARREWANDEWAVGDENSWLCPRCEAAGVTLP